MRIAIGTAQFGLPYGIANKSGQISLDQGKLLLDCAAKSGISILDTAIAYGNSEQQLGEIGVQQWGIVSKLPALPAACTNVNKWIFEQVYNSLNRLGVRRLYALLLHKPQQLLEINGHLIYQALTELKENDLVSKIGVSIYDPSELDLLCKKFHFDLIQAPFNILDHRMLDSGWFAKLSSLGVEIHTRSAFLQGLLLMQRKDIPTKFDQWRLLWDEWFDWLEKSEMSPVDACLRYVLSYSEISKVVVGVDNITQLNQLIKASRGSLPSIPEKLKVDDVNLINPANWALLN